MIDPIVKIQSLFLLGAIPIWLTSALVALLVFVSIPQSTKLYVRGGAFLCSLVASVLLYAMVGRPGYEGWGVDARTDLNLSPGEPPILAQTTYRLERDPRDPLAYAAVGDFLAQDLSISPEAPIAADASYREAEELGQLSADQYASWAGVLLVSGLDRAEWYDDSLDRILGEALRLDPKHVYARLLQTERLDRELALPVLRKIAADISTAHPWSETIDDRILMALVGEQPNIAPNLAEVSGERVDAVLSSGEANEPPFMRMVRQLEGKVIGAEGGFIQPIGDAEFDTSIVVDLYRLGRVRNVLGDQQAALEALAEALRLARSDSGIRFWIAQELWQAGQAEQAIETLSGYRDALPEGSPEWRGVGVTLESLKAATE